MSNRDWNKTEFTKSVAITPEQHSYILSVKGKKSIAGKLQEIINTYKK